MLGRNGNTASLMLVDSSLPNNFTVPNEEGGT